MAIEDSCPGLSTHRAPAFLGMDMGEWTNVNKDQLALADRRRYHSFLTDPDFRAPGGECKREVYARAFPELVNIVHHADEDETLALVLPEAVLQVLCCGVLDLSLESAARFHMDHGSYALFERLFPEGPYQLIVWNRKDHPYVESDAMPALAEESAY
jgi:broad specificity phosphatase PhoE